MKNKNENNLIFLTYIQKMELDLYIFKGFWNISDTYVMENYLFIFGDNDIRKGRGGQAVIRNQPNAFGITTKKLPNNITSSFFTDNEYGLNCKKIDNDIIKISNALETGKYKGIVISENQLGTGLAKLHLTAPKTFNYLQIQVKKLIEKYTKFTIEN